MLRVRSSGVVLVPERWGCACVLSGGVLGVMAPEVVLVPERWGCARVLSGERCVRGLSGGVLRF